MTGAGALPAASSHLSSVLAPHQPVVWTESKFTVDTCDEGAMNGDGKGWVPGCQVAMH